MFRGKEEQTNVPYLAQKIINHNKLNDVIFLLLGFSLSASESQLVTEGSQPNPAVALSPIKKRPAGLFLRQMSSPYRSPASGGGSPSLGSFKRQRKISDPLGRTFVQTSRSSQASAQSKRNLTSLEKLAIGEYKRKLSKKWVQYFIPF